MRPPASDGALRSRLDWRQPQSGRAAPPDQVNRNLHQMSATSYQQDSRCRPSRVQTASKEAGLKILGVSMSTFTLVHVPYWLSILNISLGSCRPYRRYLSRNRWVRAVQAVIDRFAAYCDGDIGRARHESHACISLPVGGAGPSLVQAFAQGAHTRNITA
jgi:hypothetical protein